MLAASPSALLVAVPSFNASSQNMTRGPRAAAENGTKPTLTASDLRKSSKKSGLSLGRAVFRMFLSGCNIHPSKALVRDTIACQPPRCQASAWPEGHIERIINRISGVPWLSHFVDGSKGWQGGE